MKLDIPYFKQENYKRDLLIFGVFIFYVKVAWAGSIEEVKKKYPAGSYLIGVGEVEPSGDNYKDRRRAEILARLEIAKTIKVTIKETTTDIACERTGKILFDNKSACSFNPVTSMKTVTGMSTYWEG